MIKFWTPQDLNWPYILNIPKPELLNPKLIRLLEARTCLNTRSAASGCRADTRHLESATPLL